MKVKAVIVQSDYNNVPESFSVDYDMVVQTLNKTLQFVTTLFFPTIVA